ncbi:MAG: AmmeMemoRadiSam system protein B [Anaerolineales bacterium]|nr:AmmeMemoRadiSam system protein B [Anaerolineales bacterium]
MSDLRPSPIAGTWYPGDAEALARSVDLQLAEAELEPAPGPVVGLIAPHAGHRYSGGVAAHAFRAVAGMSPEVVAVVSPMHQPHPAAVLSTAHAAYWTPLGTIEVDQGLLTAFEAALRRTTELAVVRVARDTEHSLEIELPFLQRCLAGPFRLLPIMLRDQSAAVAQAVGRALSEVLRGRSALVVGSSDLSHFYPAATARRLDGEMLARLVAFDPQALLQAEDEGVGFACGKGALAAVLWAARDLGADVVRLLSYANSGDVTGDDDSVVGYGAAAIYRSAGALGA